MDLSLERRDRSTSRHWGPRGADAGGDSSRFQDVETFSVRSAFSPIFGTLALVVLLPSAPLAAQSPPQGPPAGHAASPLRFSGSATVALAEGDNNYLSRVTLGVRYRPCLRGTPLCAQVGGLLASDNGLPGFERVRREGSSLRHWGAGLHVRMARWLSLGGIYGRTTQTYSSPNSVDRFGYYVFFAAGAEWRPTSWFAFQHEHIVWTARNWRSSIKDHVIRAELLSPVMTRIFISHTRSSWDQPARSFWSPSITVIPRRPFGISAGYDSKPDLGEVHVPAHNTPFVALGVFF